MLMRIVAVASILCVFQSSCCADERQIAITIDDLPFVASATNTPTSYKRTQERFMAIVNTLVDHQVPATGFVIGEAVAKNEWEFLQIFRSKGFSLGNHTYTHRSLHSISADKYIADIDKADNKLNEVMTEPKYFRFPYLDEGSGPKRKRVQEYLASHNYIIAPVTIDSKDYRFNAQLYHVSYAKRINRIEQVKARYLDYIWKQTQLAEKSSKKVEGQPIKQILLLHANLLNSYCLGDIIEMYQKNGYTFISLDDALRGNLAKPINESAIVPIPKDMSNNLSWQDNNTTVGEVRFIFA